MAKKTKSAKKDFLANQLPSSRRKQFGDIIAHRWLLLLEIGLLSLLFLLPYLIALMYKDASIASIQTGEYEDKYSRIFTITLIYSGLTLVATPIFFLGFAGFFRIFKELVYGDPIFFKDDFLQGLKENGKQFLALSMMVAIFNIADIMVGLLSNNLFIRILPFALNFSLIYPLCFVSMFISSYYSNKLGVVLKSAITIYFRKFPLIIGFFILIFGIYLFQFIGYIYVKYALIVFVIALVFPFALLGSHEAFASIFDELINKSQFPFYYKKGLYAPNDDR